MDLFDVLALIGGLCLFLFGMKVMGDGLERRAGSGLKSLLAKLSNNKIIGFLTGLGYSEFLCYHRYGRWFRQLRPDDPEAVRRRDYGC